MGGTGRAVTRAGAWKFADTLEPDLKETIMNIHKHMELIFVVVLAVLGLGSLALDYLPEAQAKPPVVVVERSIATPTSMAIVVVKARRLAQ